LGKNVEGDCEERVPGKYGDPFAKDLVVRRSPASQIVVVHAWQIVVNQGIGVDTLYCARCRQCCLGRTAARLGRGHGENGPHPFASGEEAVPHCFVDRLRACAGTRQITIERPVDQSGAFG
jgi:hypothetical protein